jgi:hypothetical protein
MPPTAEQKRIWRKNFYNKHKDHIKQYNGEKVECEICGSTIQRSYLRTHQRNKKCKKHNPNIQPNQVKPEPKPKAEPKQEPEPEPEPNKLKESKKFELHLDNEIGNSKVFTICIKC